MRKKTFKLITAALCITAVTSLTAGCAKQDNTVKAENKDSSVTVEVMTVSEMKELEENKDTNKDEKKSSGLITIDRLVEIGKIDRSRYSDELLQSFINERALTEEEAAKLNIGNCLEEYVPASGVINVEYILDGINIRKDDPTKGIKKIAFLENKGDESFCAYYDMDEGTKYTGEYTYIFDDLGSADARNINESDLAGTLDSFGVFDWKDTDTAGDETDPFSACIAIEYDDGYIFSASVRGNSLPDNYQEVKTLLMSR